VVERVTLKDVMPNAGSVLRSLLKEITIQEPAFDTTVILYRRCDRLLFPLKVISGAFIF